MILGDLLAVKFDVGLVAGKDFGEAAGVLLLEGLAGLYLFVGEVIKVRYGGGIGFPIFDDQGVPRTVYVGIFGLRRGIDFFIGIALYSRVLLRLDRGVGRT